MIDGKKISALLAEILEKSFNNGVIIPTKMRFCNEGNDKRLCNKCNLIVSENKGVETKLNLSKRQAPNDFGMTPYFKE